ncbi:hypothetical protein OG884_17625 [Streptosporangium sp. NBC_01755]|uniref:hypothetical protein n=1 Tax=unclassified Streptosporangium TaxID=2632669 RepID=UPI002DDA7E70|nr:MULTISPECIES: hypothetical protein [unclassified Streptosporangium]WSA25039.1 hypothetical protein OIE13_29540 [Streptosporangium sp. NBC_01810]WSD03630.1 hypothetical protein OG884_17625 [Streptosporangium sp. NBC_01755]
MAKRLADSADDWTRERLPTRESLVRSIKGWEAGKHRPGEPYITLYCRVFGFSEAELFKENISISPDASAVVGIGALDPFAADGRLADADYVMTLRTTGQALVSLDTVYGGNEIFPLALRIFRTASAKLAAGSFTTAVERDLEAATGEAGEVAAWIAYDADRQDASRQIIHEAMMLSRLAGDRDMELFELAHLSMLSLAQHRPHETLRIADDVLTDSVLPPRVKAIFEVRRGRALAALGDRARGFDALQRARSALAESISIRDPYWAWWMDEAELAGHQGLAHAELGEWGKAVAPLMDAYGSTRGRSRYNFGASLLNGLVHAQAWQEAEPIVVDVMAQASEIGSARTSNLLLRVADRIERAGTGPTSTLADLAQDMRRMLAWA